MTQNPYDRDKTYSYKAAFYGIVLLLLLTIFLCITSHAQQCFTAKVKYECSKQGETWSDWVKSPSDIEIRSYNKGEILIFNNYAKDKYNLILLTDRFEGKDTTDNVLFTAYVYDAIKNGDTCIVTRFEYANKKKAYRFENKKFMYWYSNK